MTKTKPYTSRDKWILAIIAGLIFLLLASPFLFGITNKATQSFGLTIASDDGCPNLAGIIIHTLVFICVIRLLIR